MAKDPEAVKIMQMRKLILENLNRLYPTPVLVGTLYKVMCGFDEHYDFSLFQKDIVYLSQKSYIRFIDDVIGGSTSFRSKVIGLTAQGKEIADRTQRDSALEI